jgi:molybdopterin converting factor small subunit
MTVTLLLPGMLRGEVEGASTLHVGGSGTLAEVLDEIGRNWPRLERRLRDEQGQLRRYVNIYINGEECRFVGGLGAAVGDGAEIQVLASVAGG